MIVFAAFMLEDNRDIKEFGLGLAAAVLMDAVVIRSMIVPCADDPARPLQLVVPPPAGPDPPAPVGGGSSGSPLA